MQKAQIEKAEIKADMTKERLELSQDLLLEREHEEGRFLLLLGARARLPCEARERR